MPADNKLIGPISDGLRKDVKPYAIPPDSFEVLTNAYQWRGRIVRRPGYTLLGRLTNNTPVMGLRTRETYINNAKELVAFDTTDDYFYNQGTNTFDPLPSFMPVTWSGTDYQFFYTINYAGAFWATNSKPGLHGFAITGAFANQAGTGLTATVDVTAAGNTFVVGDFVYFLNVTGIAAANNLAYGQVTAINVGGNPDVFTVTSLNSNASFAFVNGAVTTGMVISSTTSITGQDGIRYYGDLNYGGATVNTSWANYNPPLNDTDALCGALLIFSYRGYLVFLNTWEGNEGGVVNYPNRARWTQIGTPYYSLPVPTLPNLQTYDPLAVRDDIFGRGGANDAPTSEIIIGAGFIRDILVVFFERSTWRLRFVNNSQNPFVWERVNVELGSDCTFSAIPFDKGLMGIGNRGIVISDANDTARFDEKIPDDIFTIRQSNNGLRRVYGIRTFRTRLNYWTFPSELNENGVYPDLVLVFNYDTKNWSFFDDCFTCFGYFYPSGGGKTWNDLDLPWPSYNSENAANGVTQEGYETILAGNQQGFVFELEQTSPTNDPSLYIASINLLNNTLNSPSNNLPDGTWIKITGVTGTTSSDGVSLNGRNFKISNPTDDPDNFSLNEFDPITAGNASGSTFTYNIDFIPILQGSVQIDVGSIQFTDPNLDGILQGSDGTSSGTLNYISGDLTLNFSPPLGAPTAVNIRIVSADPEQEIEPVILSGAYGGGGLISKISNIDIQTKIFNYFENNQSIRLNRIDFYTGITQAGQFTCNVFADSSDVPANEPLQDNLQTNVVLTSLNPYQVPSGTETIYRLYCYAVCQTIQLQFTLSDRQMAVSAINGEDIEINAVMLALRKAGRLV